MAKLIAYLNLSRVSHWPKNLLVFIGIIYSKTWHDHVLWQHVISLSIAFCLISSAIYVINDIHDRENDRNHPLKKNRPIAQGIISINHGYLFFSVLLVASIIIAYQISHAALLILLAYCGLNLAYTFFLKHIPILDACSIAGGFVLRVLAGTIGVGIPPSLWLLVCTAVLTLFLGFSKRRAEINIMGPQNALTRPVLQHYQQTYLDILILICAVLTFLSYTVYCLHHDDLLLTLPFVGFGIARYLFVLYSTPTNDDPVMLILNDNYSMFNIIIWFVLTLYLLSTN